MIVDIGALPIWQGVQDKPGFKRLPFKFGIDDGLVRLELSETDLASITEAYSSDAYSFITSPPGSSDWGNRLGDWYCRLLAERVGSLAGKRVLEIGAGTLYIAEKIVAELGAREYVACDPALQEADGTGAIDVVRKYFTAEYFTDQEFELVLSINTLEHIPDPSAHLRDIRSLLDKTGGLLYLVVPDCLRGLREGDLGICIHEHLTYFTMESLEGLLAASGFSAEWLYSEDDTIFAIARADGAVRSRRKDKTQAFALLDQFKGRYEHNLRAADDLIGTQRGAGSVGIHGCSVGLNNTLALLELDGDAGIHLFDGDERKVGKYLPACLHPIKAAGDSHYATMDLVVVAAMTYFAEIKKSIMGEHGVPVDRIRPIIPPVTS
jgi:SAM-dependent methyltransferase